MGSVGDTYDNAVCESFAALDYELLARRQLASQADMIDHSRVGSAHVGQLDLGPEDSLDDCNGRRNNVVVACAGGAGQAAHWSPIKSAQPRLAADEMIGRLEASREF